MAHILAFDHEVGFITLALKRSKSLVENSKVHFDMKDYDNLIDKLKKCNLYREDLIKEVDAYDLCQNSN